MTCPRKFSCRCRIVFIYSRCTPDAVITSTLLFFSVHDIRCILLKNQISTAINWSFVAFEIIQVLHPYNRTDHTYSYVTQWPWLFRWPKRISWQILHRQKLKSLGCSVFPQKVYRYFSLFLSSIIWIIYEACPNIPPRKQSLKQTGPSFRTAACDTHIRFSRVTNSLLTYVLRYS